MPCLSYLAPLPNNLCLSVQGVMLLGVHVPLVHIHPCPPTHSLAHAQALEHTVIAPVKLGASPSLSCAHQLIPSVSIAFFLPSSHLSLPLCCSVGQLGKEREGGGELGGGRKSAQESEPAGDVCVLRRRRGASEERSRLFSC